MESDGICAGSRGITVDFEQSLKLLIRESVVGAVPVDDLEDRLALDQLEGLFPFGFPVYDQLDIVRA